MMRIVRRVQLLTVLALLLSGLLQPLSAAHGLRCARSHAQAAGAAALDSAPEQVEPMHAAGASQAVSGEHQHAPDSGTDATLLGTAPCSAAAIPVERSTLLQSYVAPTLLSPGDLPPASLLIRSLFRPPRLS